jgi:hypothetical protein
MVLVRSVLYASMPRDAGMSTSIGQRLQAPVPPRLSGASSFTLTDVHGTTAAVTSIPQSTGDVIMVPAQYRTGVVKVRTQDSAAVLGVTVHRPAQESVLSFFDDATWRDRVKPMVASTDRIVSVDAAEGMERAVTHARIGSELWPLFIVLALCCALAEMVVARMGMREAADASVT